MKRPITAVIVGAGNRGSTYASYSREYPDQLSIVAVADLKAFARCQIQKWFDIPQEKCFTTWSELCSAGKIADCAIIAVNDAAHKDCALAFAKCGYDILLEKPMAVTPADCVEIENECRKCGVILAVCHVLRYFPPVLAIKKCLMDGCIGEIVNIQHRENIGFWHFAHSFVRGNWRNTAQSSFSLLSKCCHDIDLIKFWMGDKKCVKISSFGSLLHFNKCSKPSNAGARCLVDCDIEDNCPYSCKKIYMDTLDEGKVSWPHDVVCEPGCDYKERLQTALKEGPYGRCVYECDNDVCDNQTVQFLYDNGATATLTMVAFTEKNCVRESKIVGTHGEISWNGKPSGPVLHYDFLSKITSELKLDLVQDVASSLSGHGGADFYLMKSFVAAVANKSNSGLQTTAQDALESHLLVFAAEESRQSGTITDYAKFKADVLSLTS